MRYVFIFLNFSVLFPGQAEHGGHVDHMSETAPHCFPACHLLILNVQLIAELQIEAERIFYDVLPITSTITSVSWEVCTWIISLILFYSIHFYMFWTVVCFLCYCGHSHSAGFLCVCSCVNSFWSSVFRRLSTTRLWFTALIFCPVPAFLSPITWNYFAFLPVSF